MAAGDSRGTIFNGFVGSDEFTKICQSYGINRGNGDWSNASFVITGNCQICGTKNNTVSDFVTRLYNVCLDRNPDGNGLNSWINTIINGQSGAQTAYGFVFSNEFQSKNLCNEHFVEYMYKAFFGREADETGKSGWMKVLSDGGTKGHVFSGFTGSDEFKKLCAQYGISAGNEDFSAMDFTASGPCAVCGWTEPSNPQQPGTSYQQKYNYKMFIVNKYEPLYTNNSFASINVYIRTDNPSSEGFYVNVNGETTSIVQSFSDVDEGNIVSNPKKVEGGYLYSFTPENPGSYTISVDEIKEGYYENYVFYNDRTPGIYCTTNSALTFTCDDYQTAYDSWLKGLVNKYTTSGMSPEEKFYAICQGEFYSGNYTYDEVIMQNGEYIKAHTLKDSGTIWQNHRLNSANSPQILDKIGDLVGYNVKIISYDYTDAYHAYVETPDGNLVTICPMPETGDLGTVKPFDFSTYK